MLAITRIINTCLLENVFPSIAIPLPNIATLGSQNDLTPISILPAHSKLIEKVVAIKMRNFLDANDFMPSEQSGFRAGYSCESGMFHVVDDILQGIDKNQVIPLIISFSF